MSTLKVGTKAPAFTLPAQDGKTYSLKDFKGKKIVLYFYPKDNTSGCTREACDFRDNLSAFKKKGAVVIGMSSDSASSHKKFSEKHELTFTLLSDEDKAILTAYGVWKEKSMYGRKYMGIERTTVVIDEKGIVTHIYPKVKVTGHIDEILSVL
ncbi:MAG: thioredoxin-dependent thiol peroxidase [Ignavibacteriales bacterium]|nr:thioredoxin-dependent thiol peroxidase [Ignavibacteriales bacterium]